MTSINPAQTNLSLLSLGDGVFSRIFVQVDNARSYTALGQTCRLLHDISLSIPVIANCSLPSRRFLLKFSLLSDPNLHVASLYAKKAALEAAIAVFSPRMPIALEKKAELDAIQRALKQVPAQSHTFQPTAAPYEDFYLLFKKACTRLNVNINEKDFLHCVFGMHGLCRGFSASVWRNVYTDVLAAFVEQPVEAITINAFCQKVKDLHQFAEGKSWLDVETDARKCLKVNKGRGFFEFAKLLQSRNQNQLVREIGARKRASLEAEMAKMRQELQILEDSSGLCGSVQEAGHLMSQALAARTQAYSAYIQLTGGTSSFSCEVEKCKTAPTEIKKAFETLVSENNQFCELREEYLKRNMRQNCLVRRDALGKIIGGKLHDVDCELRNVHNSALEELTLTIRFYFELDRDVTDSNKEIRHTALQRIISQSPNHSHFPFG